MYPNCIKCGSKKTHGSRARPGERTVGMLFLRPVRCRDCRERFWVRNPHAYVAVGSTVTVGALLIALVWLIIEHNMADSYFGPISEIELEKPSIPGDSNPGRVHEEHLNAAAVGAQPPIGTPTIHSAKPASPSTQSPTDDHYFTVRLYEDSAEKGDSDAQYKLGLLYLTGNGALQDFAEAAKWLELAAEQGYGLAQYELGLIYRTGYGLPIDQVQSYVWLNLAAAAGVQQAVTARDEIMRSLNTKQLAQAQKISRDWLATRPKPKMTRENSGQAEPRVAPVL